MPSLLESPVTLVLLALNVLVAVYTFAINPNALDRLAFKPYLATHRNEVWRFVTAGFVHVGLAHLLFNMVTLFSLGPIVESVLGPGRFIAVYLGSDIAANLLTLVRFRNDPSYSAVGASGAISGVVFAFCLFFPLERLYIFFIPFGIYAIIFAGIYILLSILAAQQGGGRIAHEAHIGGAIGGLLLTLLLYPTSLSIFLSQLGL